MKDKCKWEYQVKRMKHGFEEEELVQIKGKGKGKVHNIPRHERPEWKYRRSSTISLTLALGGGWSTLRSPGIKTRYPLFRRLGGPQGLSGHVRKILHPSGLD